MALVAGFGWSSATGGTRGEGLGEGCAEGECRERIPRSLHKGFVGDGTGASSGHGDPKMGWGNMREAIWTQIPKP
jgi:hypothetical protein